MGVGEKEMGCVINYFALAVLAAICTAAVLSPSYRDNFVQRVGLSLTAIGATLQIWNIYQLAGSSTPLTLVAYGAAIYALGTMQQNFRDQQSKRSPHYELGRKRMAKGSHELRSAQAHR